MGLGLPSSKATAQSNRYQRIPDLGILSFDDLRFGESGVLNLQQVWSQLGYDPSRGWIAGQSLSQALQLGDYGGSFPYSLRDIATAAAVPLHRYRLSAFKLLRSQSIADLVQAIPGLSSRLITQVPLIAALLNHHGVGFSANNTVADLLSDSGLANLQLGNIDLSVFSFSSLPGLANAPLDGFQGWQSTTFAEVPALGQLPILALSGSQHPLAPGGGLGGVLEEPDAETAVTFVQLDIAFGPAEKKALRSVSGSYNQGFQVPCVQTRGCSHIELTGQCVGNCLPFLDPRQTPLGGKQWISGRDQKVIGGSGLLIGSEPTGRHPPPFDSELKLVLTDTDEAKGEATFSAYARICTPVGCSPYVIGPLPLYQVSEKGWLLF